jgi:hypothetical protein
LWMPVLLLKLGSCVRLSGETVAFQRIKPDLIKLEFRAFLQHKQ